MSDDQYLMGIYSKNVVEKFAWFLLALENGHIHGGYSVSEVGRLLSVEQQFQIAVSFENGGGGFPKSFENAKYWNEKALSQRHTKAQEFQSELLKMEQDFKLANTGTKQTNLNGIETSLKDGFGVVVEKVVTGVKIVAAIIFVITVPVAVFGVAPKTRQPTDLSKVVPGATPETAREPRALPQIALQNYFAGGGV
jgi:hypothetical protein